MDQTVPFRVVQRGLPGQMLLTEMDWLTKRLSAAIKACVMCTVALAFASRDLGGRPVIEWIVPIIALDMASARA